MGLIADYTDVVDIEEVLWCYDYTNVLEALDVNYDYIVAIIPSDYEADFYEGRARVFNQSNTRKRIGIYFLRMTSYTRDYEDGFHKVYDNLLEVVYRCNIAGITSIKKAVCLYSKNDDVMKVGDVVFSPGLRMKDQWLN